MTRKKSLNHQWRCDALVQPNEAFFPNDCGDCMECGVVFSCDGRTLKSDLDFKTKIKNSSENRVKEHTSIKWEPNNEACHALRLLILQYQVLRADIRRTAMVPAMKSMVGLSLTAPPTSQNEHAKPQSTSNISEYTPCPPLELIVTFSSRGEVRAQTLPWIGRRSD